MSFENYGALKAEVLTWNWNRNSSQIDSFCRLAHAEINKRLRGTPMQATADITIDARRVAAPSDMQAVGGRLYLDADCKAPLMVGSPEQIARLAAQYADGGAQPQKFAIEGEDDGLLYFVFAPEPDQTYTGKLLYARSLDFFASDAATNFLLLKWPKLYLYGALLEAALYADDTARVDKFLGLFNSEVESVKAAVRDDQMAGSTMQVSSPYVV